MPNFKPRRFEVTVVAGLAVGLWFVLLSSYQHARDSARGRSCQSNLKQLGLAVSQYTRNYDEKYPLVNSWRENLMPYLKNDYVFHCPARTAHGYAFNGYLNGQSYNSQGSVQSFEDIPLIFESSLLSPNAVDFGRSWPRQKVHPQGNAIVFADGHVEWLLAPPVFLSFTTPSKLVPPL